MRAVIDTNVVVSALLSRHSAPADVVRLALQGDVIPLYDDRIISEYRDVLARPRFGFDQNDVRALIDGLRFSGEMVYATPLTLELTDPDDLIFLEVASAGSADALVTGNTRHYKPVRGRHSVRVMTPRAFLQQGEGEGGG